MKIYIPQPTIDINDVSKAELMGIIWKASRICNLPDKYILKFFDCDNWTVAVDESNDGFFKDVYIYIDKDDCRPFIAMTFFLNKFTPSIDIKFDGNTHCTLKENDLVDICKSI